MRTGFANFEIPEQGEQTPKLSRCGACGLARQCHSPRMPVTGSGEKKILFVAEAPGADEDQQGVQLVGDAGKLLRRVLHGIGEELDDCWKTNAVICRPPRNEIKDIYIESCRPNLLRTIAELKPTVIVLLGLSAVQSLVRTEWKREIGLLGRWVGWKIPSSCHGSWICPTYHPSYLNRMNENPVLMRMLSEHIEAAFKLERQGPPQNTPLDALKSQVEIVLDRRAARKKMRALARKSGILAFDYETTGLKPDDPKQRIVSCAFCLDGKETWACMIDETMHRALSAVLRNKKLLKVASNIKFEERWTLAKLGHPVAGWDHDTMLEAHIQDNRRGITSLKFQAYVLLGIGDYESSVAPFLKAQGGNGLNRIRGLPPEELLLYNGLDARLEYEVMKIQRQRRIS